MPETAAASIDDLISAGADGDGTDGGAPSLESTPTETKPEAQPGGLATAKVEEQKEQTEEEKIDLQSLRLQQLEQAKQKPEQQQQQQPQQQQFRQQQDQRPYREFDPRSVELYKAVVQHPAFDIQYIQDLAQEDQGHAIAFGVASAIAALEKDITTRASGEAMEGFQNQQIVTNAYNLLLNEFPEIAEAGQKHGRHVNAMIDSVSNDFASQLGFETAKDYVLAAYEAGRLDNIQKFARLVGQEVKGILNLQGVQVEAPGAIQGGRGMQKTAKVAPKRGTRGTDERNSRRSTASTSVSSGDEPDKLKWGTFDEFPE